MTTALPSDPLALGGIARFGERLRKGETTAKATVQDYLARIDALDDALDAYQHLDGELALKQAQAIDLLLASGTDLGPLMGVPVCLKDIFAVDGMPVTAGSKIDVSDLIGTEGNFVKQLKRAGCVLLGLTRTVEFALGATGTNYNQGTPRNPWDGGTFRLASGSSSGSAVAMAAGLCGFAIGSDTGGSVRGPAAYCGVVGLKTTAGLWPLDGVFPFSKTFDTIGPLTGSVADAALVTSALLGKPSPAPRPLRAVRLGRASALFEDADAEVAGCIDAALDALVQEGAQVTDVEFDEFREANEVFTIVSRPELIAHMGAERFEASRDRMNPDVADRAAPGLAISAAEYARGLWRYAELRRFATDAMLGFDAWIAPTKLRLAPPYAGAFESLDGERALTRHCAGPTRQATALGLCAASLPVQQFGSPLPVGMQVIGPANEELRLLSLCLTIEKVIGAPSLPDLSPFLNSHKSKTATARGKPH
jgi:aspartyl-tRNA(Asn)/glutamyl-tRNA(Gln) amidotransferase subunit A